MRRVIRLGGAFLGLVLLLVISSGARGSIPAEAAATNDYQLSPTSGPPGTVVHISPSFVICAITSAPAYYDVTFANALVKSGVATDNCKIDDTFVVPAAPPGSALVQLFVGSCSVECAKSETNFTFMVTGPASDASVTITTDKSVYTIGDSILVCYVVSRAGRVVITDQLASGTTRTILDGPDDGTGDCLPGVVGPPPGKETLKIVLYDGTNPIASASTAFEIRPVPAPVPSPSPTAPPPTKQPTSGPPADGGPTVHKIVLPPALRTGATQKQVCDALDKALGSFTTKHKNVVVVTHGWNGPIPVLDQSNEFAEQTADEIQAYLISTQQSDWDIVSVRWFGLSATAAWDPDQSRWNGISIGSCLGVALSKLNYSHFHLIGHSAGASLVNEASKVIKFKNKSATVHLTFLDAYTPDDLWKGNFGSSADYTEHYVRRDFASDILNPNPFRKYPALFLLQTDRAIANACNYDVSRVTDPANVQDLHGGPINYYRSTITRVLVDIGFGKSKEVTGIAPKKASCSGKLGVMISVADGSVSAPLPDVIKRLDPIASGLFSKTTSTGTLTPGPGSAFSLISGSPVEVSAQVSVPAGTAFLQFTHHFLSSSQGLLTVFLDGTEIYGTIEEAEAGEVVDAGMISLPDGTAPGAHALALRLEPLGASPSEIEVSDVHFGVLQESANGTPSPGRPTAPLPPNTGSGEVPIGSPLPYAGAGVLVIGLALTAGWWLRRVGKDA